MMDFDEAMAVMLTPIATCRGCGCTDIRACPGGCSWASVNRRRRTGLCSRCAAKKKKKKSTSRA
jgi:hypothetical protein